ncbi:MAG: anti-sigma factor family protein [Burkholderiales bacterium]
MNCNECTGLMGASVDREIGRWQGRSLKRHLAACPDCAARHDEALALRTRLRAELPRHVAPPELRSRVQAMLETMQPPGSARTPGATGRWRWLGTGALAGCALTVLTWVAGTTLLDMRARDDIAVEAVTSHVRATLGNHVIQVASSDQHTVKPWLSARLDYSPPVPDMRAQGFTLVGGRIDYLDGRPVATLVYRIRDHMIDVFVRPQAAGSLAAAPRTLRGFHVVEVRGSAMDWLAVSDVGADVLQSFVEDVARRE